MLSGHTLQVQYNTLDVTSSTGIGRRDTQRPLMAKIHNDDEEIKKEKLIVQQRFRFTVLCKTTSTMTVTASTAQTTIAGIRLFRVHFSSHVHRRLYFRFVGNDYKSYIFRDCMMLLLSRIMHKHIATHYML